MKKTILTFVMMMTMAFTLTAVPTIKANNPKSQTNVELKGDTIVVTDGDESVTVSGLPELQKMRDKINRALDDTLTAGNGTTVEFGNHEGDLSPEDIKYMSDHWGEVAKHITYASIAGLLGLVLLVMLFRFLNRRNKYRVIEKAIENNYPLNELSLNDVKRSAIYVQQPVVAAAPPMSAAPQMGAAPQPGQVPVGTPIEGMTPQNPVVMTDMFNWRALMPAIRLLGWGLFITLFGILVVGDGGMDPVTLFGILLMFLGLGKGFILYKEQQALQEAWRRSQQMQPREPMREGIPVPPPFDEDYKADDDSGNYQPY